MHDITYDRTTDFRFLFSSSFSLFFLISHSHFLCGLRSAMRILFHNSSLCVCLVKRKRKTLCVLATNCVVNPRSSPLNEYSFILLLFSIFFHFILLLHRHRKLSFSFHLAYSLFTMLYTFMKHVHSYTHILLQNGFANIQIFSLKTLHLEKRENNEQKKLYIKKEVKTEKKRKKKFNKS